MKANMRELSPSKMKQTYTRSDVKDWISFGIKNGYVNQFKKDEVAKWADLILKHGVVNLRGDLLLGEKSLK
jgi:hypothetical protein